MKLANDLKVKKTIGRKDKGDFPELNLKNIDIKIDTGAYTSAIHCHKIKTKEIDGRQVLTFTLLDPSHPQYNNKELSTENLRKSESKVHLVVQRGDLSSKPTPVYLENYTPLNYL